MAQLLGTFRSPLVIGPQLTVSTAHDSLSIETPQICPMDARASNEEDGCEAAIVNENQKRETNGSWEGVCLLEGKESLSDSGQPIAMQAQRDELGETG